MNATATASANTVTLGDKLSIETIDALNAAKPAGCVLGYPDDAKPMTVTLTANGHSEIYLLVCSVPATGYRRDILAALDAATVSDDEESLIVVLPHDEIPEILSLSNI